MVEDSSSAVSTGSDSEEEGKEEKEQGAKSLFSMLRAPKH